MTTHHITFHSRNTPFTTIFKTSLIPTTTSTIIRNNNNSQLPRTKDVSLALEANQIFAISLYGLGVMATVKMHGVDETKDVSSPSISSPVSSEGELEVTPEDSDEVEVLSDDDDDDDTVEPEGLDVDISITSEEVAYEEVSSTEEVEVEPEDSDDVGVLNDEDDEEEESTSSPTSIFDEASRQLDKTFQEMTKISDLKKSVSSTVEGELEKIDRLKSTEDEVLKESESSVAVIEEEEFEEVDPTKKTRIIVKIIKKAIRPWKKWSTL